MVRMKVSTSPVPGSGAFTYTGESGVTVGMVVNSRLVRGHVWISSSSSWVTPLPQFQMPTVRSRVVPGAA